MGGIDLDRIEGEFLQAFLRDGDVSPVSIIVAGGSIVDSLPVLGDRASSPRSCGGAAGRPARTLSWSTRRRGAPLTRLTRPVRP